MVRSRTWCLACCLATLAVTPLQAQIVPRDSNEAKIIVKKKIPWWKKSIVYEINPRSFKDTNGDGIGDLNGIISQLDYLKELGVDVLWITPHYDSPNIDNGYDIRDYKKIMKELGTMKDFDRLMSELKKRNMRLTIDMVLNHTSDQHEWFKKSRSSRTNPYRNYFFWQASNQKKPPNNYISVFGGSTWELDKNTDQYYLHYFSKYQPDLNWDSPKVRQELYKILDFWLKKGVSGIRLDTITTISKIPGFPDLPNSISALYAYSQGPHLHEYIREMHHHIYPKYDLVSFGEMVAIPNEQFPLFFDPSRDELDISINLRLVYFDRIKLNFWQSKPFLLTDYTKTIDATNQSVGQNGWNAFYLANHDTPRAVSHFGSANPQYFSASAKALATLLLTQRGTPILYQGDEIGMTNYPFSSLTEIKDIQSHLLWNQLVKSGKLSEQNFFHYVRLTGRDNARTPFQWDDSASAGFTTGTPWIQVNPNYKTINAKQNIENPDSIYHYYRQIIQVRRSTPALTVGDYQNIAPANKQIYAYTRSLGRSVYLIVINFTEKKLTYVLPDKARIAYTVIQSNTTKKPLFGATKIQLRPWQSGVYRLFPSARQRQPSTHQDHSVTPSPP